MGWIAVESGGNIRSITKYDERGFFQLMPSESETLGLDHPRLSVDPEYSIASGFKLIEWYSNRIAKLGIPYGTDAFWWLVKLAHGIGIGSLTVMIADMRSRGIEPSSPEVFRSYFGSSTSGTPQNENDRRVSQAIKSKYGNVHIPSKWIANADKVFNQGKVYAALGQLSNPQVAIPVLAAIGIALWLLLRR